MSKKLLSLVSFLFLLTVLAISCSNTGKTGSDDSNGGSGTGDGGTTPQGIAKHAGTWELTQAPKQGQNTQNTMTIKNDGTIDLNLLGEQQSSINDITDKGNEEYEIKFIPNGQSEVYILTLKFSDDNNGTFILSADGLEIGNGIMTKQQ